MNENMFTVLYSVILNILKIIQYNQKYSQNIEKKLYFNRNFIHNMQYDTLAGCCYYFPFAKRGVHFGFLFWLSNICRQAIIMEFLNVFEMYECFFLNIYLYFIEEYSIHWFCRKVLNKGCFLFKFYSISIINRIFVTIAPDDVDIIVEFIQFFHWLIFYNHKVF